MRRKLCMLLGLALLPSTAFGQSDDPESFPGNNGRARSVRTVRRAVPDSLVMRDEAFQAVRDINEQVKALGPWERESEIVVNATRRIFARNGWGSDTDVFAMHLSEEVARIPPWQYTERFNKFIGLLSHRYRLDRNQEQFLRAQMVAESFGFFMKHAPEIIEQGQDMVATRAEKKPFTADQVARWAEVSQPMLTDWHDRLSRMSERMLDRLRPDQVDRAREDLQNWNERLDDVSDLMGRWAEGQWNPAEWGLERLPEYQAQNVQRPPQRGPEPAAAPDANAGQLDPDAAVARDESQWERYVREFIARYQLDNAQQTTAQGILKEMFDRATQTRASRADQLQRLDQLIAQAEEPGVRNLYNQQREALLRPIRSLFDELKSRLDRLPTSAQRAAAAGGS